MECSMMPCKKMFLPHPHVKVSIVGSLRDREVACSASDRQGSNFESCLWRTVSSQSYHHPQEVLLAQFSLYVHKGGLKLDSFYFLWCRAKANTRNCLFKRRNQITITVPLVLEGAKLPLCKVVVQHLLTPMGQSGSLSPYNSKGTNYILLP